MATLDGAAAKPRCDDGGAPHSGSLPGKAQGQSRRSSDIDDCGAVIEKVPAPNLARGGTSGMLAHGQVPRMNREP
jgi:hypothetical protein